MALSYERGVDLAFDMDVMRSAAERYQNAAEELRQLKSELEGLLSGLTASGWTTEAGKTFETMVSQDWGTNLEKYCDLISTLSQILNESAAKYDELISSHVDTLRL